MIDKNCYFKKISLFQAQRYFMMYDSTPPPNKDLYALQYSASAAPDSKSVLTRLHKCHWEASD